MCLDDPLIERFNLCIGRDVHQYALSCVKLVFDLKLFPQVAHAVNTRFSPQGLIANFEILHGGLFKGVLIRGEGLIEKVCTTHGGLFETACFLHATIILG